MPEGGDRVIHIIAWMMAIKQEADRQIIRMLQALPPQTRAEEVRWIHQQLKEEGTWTN